VCSSAAASFNGCSSRSSIEVVPDLIGLAVAVSRLMPAVRWVLGDRQVDPFKKGTAVSKVSGLPVVAKDGVTELPGSAG
jgi:hypothetical protein